MLMKIFSLDFERTDFWIAFPRCVRKSVFENKNRFKIKQFQCQRFRVAKISY